MSSTPVTYTSPIPIQVRQPSVKRSGALTCVGWVQYPQYKTSNTLVLLAVADVQGEVVGSDAALRFELVQYGADYRLQFSGSMSKLINKTVAIDLNDKYWHNIGWVCTGEGVMYYYVDGVSVPAEGGLGTDGIPYTTAWSRVARRGGGDVWCPYLTEKYQAVTMFRWRMTGKVAISQSWVKDLMEYDRPSLPPLNVPG